MKRSLFETMLGAVVLAAAAFFLFFAYSAADLKTTSGYQVNATFSKIGGLTAGNDVRISGVKVGNINTIELDKTTYQARVTMTMESDVALPVDSVAQVATEGLLGGYFMSINPGVEEDALEEGGEIQFTQAPVDLLDLIGKAAFSSASED